MAAPRKYPDELRERATRLAVEARKDPAGRAGVIKRIADQLDVHPEALRGWVKRAETDDGMRPGITGADATRIAELEREVKELRRANAILKSASAFFAAELPAFDIIRRAGGVNPGFDLGGRGWDRLEGVSLGGGVRAGQRGAGWSVMT
ncbi:transposase, partial [Streptomyces sp. NPDC096153]|uniref:transposase n=1 Tax=Streptomyces sp. NPDC096153 TaxID=3155548 RepID=UPI00331A197A